MRDLRYAVRFLWTHPSFTAASVLTLAIGLGANTALYGLLNAALRPLPVPHPEQLVSVTAEPKDDNTGGFHYSFSLETLKDFQERAEPFSTVFGHMLRIGGMSVDGRATQFWFDVVSDNYFTALGVAAEHGTLFTGPSGSPVHVVLGHAFWLKTFGGAADVIGKAVLVNGVPAVVTGVVARSFRGTQVGIELDGYVTVDDYGVLSPDVKRWLYHN